MHNKIYSYRDSSLIKPVSRKWIPVGIFFGFAISLLCYSLPDPFQSFTLWVGSSAGMGSIGTLAIFTKIVGSSRLKNVPNKLWWLVIILGPIVGAVVGFVQFYREVKFPEDLHGGIGIIGMLVGYAAVELWIRKTDRDRTNCTG